MIVPRGWKKVAIRDLISSSLPGEWGTEGLEGVDAPVLRSSNFRDDGSVDYSDIAFRKVPADRLASRRIARGTILIEKSGGGPARPAGRVVYSENDFGGTASNFVQIVQIQDTESAKFAFYLLHFNYHNGLVLKYQQQTTGIINFKLRQYVDEAVVLPASKHEQLKIAEILSAVDSAIEQTEALIAKELRIKTGLMQDLLARGIDCHGALRSEQTHKFKHSPLGRVPAEWDVIDLGSSGTWTSGGTPSMRISRFWDGDIPWICPKDMKTLDLVNSIDNITQEGVRCGSRLMPKGTVFIVIRGMILAHTFPVGYATRPMAFNQDVKAVVARPGLSSRYLAYWLVARADAILKIATTSTHGTKRFDMDDLFSVRVAVPKLEEQKLITSAFDSWERQFDLIRAHLGKLRALRIGLMQDLLTGNRRVTTLLSLPGVVNV